MAYAYVSEESVREAVEYFKRRNDASPEQVGLFFLFKALRVSNREYVTYLEDGNERRAENEAKRKKILKFFYNLGAVFNADNEDGGKRTCLFPFAIADTVGRTCFFNGGTPFKSLYGRVSDTVDNTLIDKYLQKEDQASKRYKFKSDYIDMIYSDFLRGNKISLKMLAAWYFRFHAFTVDDGWLQNHTGENDKTFTRICVKKLTEELNLNNDELAILFDSSGDDIRYSARGITGPNLRNMINFTAGESPEVALTNTPVNYMERGNIMYAEEVINLAAPHGKNITTDELERLLLDTHQVILSGPPGTGKSHIANEMKGRFHEAYLMQFHASLTYEQFIGGNTFGDGNVIIPKAGVFLEFCTKAKRDPGRKYLFIIDEINRGNVSKIFGETIIALDREYTAKLPMKLTTGNGEVSEFSIPENVYILATMNSADRSIALVDYAIRRRFSYVAFYPNSEIIEAVSNYDALSGVRVEDLMCRINDKLYEVLKDPDILLGQSYFMPKWARAEDGKIHWTKGILRRLFNYRILPIIEEYTYGNRRHLESIVGDELCKRISDDDDFMEKLKHQFLG